MTVAGSISLSISLSGAISDATLCQIIGCQLDCHLVTGKNADVMLAHFAGYMCSHNVTVFKFNLEGSIGKGINDSTFHFN